MYVTVFYLSLCVMLKTNKIYNSLNNLIFMHMFIQSTYFYIMQFLKYIELCLVIEIIELLEKPDNKDFRNNNL